MGRQPFVVAPNPNPSGVDGVFMFTAAAVSPGVTAGELLFSLDQPHARLRRPAGRRGAILLVRYVRGGVAGAMPELGSPDDRRSRRPRPADDVLAFAY